MLKKWKTILVSWPATLPSIISLNWATFFHRQKSRSSGQKSMLSLPSAWVQSLGGELISHKPHSTATHTQKKKSGKPGGLFQSRKWKDEKVLVFLLGACASGQFCGKNQNGTPWPGDKHVQGEPEGAGVIGALRVRTWEVWLRSGVTFIPPGCEPWRPTPHTH